MVNNSPKLLAHSPPNETSAPQTYREHLFGDGETSGVAVAAAGFAASASRHHPTLKDTFAQIVSIASEYHDLGKLLPENQEVLARVSHEALPLRHEDAGAAYLLQQKFFEGAFLVYCHHSGLESLPKERLSPSTAFRLKNCHDPDQAAKLRERVDQELDGLTEAHRSATGRVHPLPFRVNLSSLERRIALSCLVDADHSDTAAFRERSDRKSSGARRIPALRAKERLSALSTYVSNMQKGAPQTELNRLRGELFAHCKAWRTDEHLLECDAPVSSGKTTSVMAHLLETALLRRLDRIFVVLPYTTIIDQSVAILREALTLPGEDAEAVVIAHHHRAEFASEALRSCAATWNAPIVVTTAVQFWQAISAAHTTSLRRLHRVCNSAIMVDEAHASMPIHLWRQHWEWIKELANNWGCHFVMASGSLTRVWEMQDAVATPQALVSLVPQRLAKDLALADTRRLTVKTNPTPLTLETLCSFVSEQPGPRVIVMNTVQNAAVVALRLSQIHGRKKVMHLSTALCPIHRTPIVQKIFDRLKAPNDLDWYLVATSCIEAGMNFSFVTGFRERCSLLSFVQLGGRVNRNLDRTNATLWDIEIHDPSNFSVHPDFEQTAILTADFAKNGRLDATHSSDFIKMLLRTNGVKHQLSAQEIVNLETQCNYPDVAKSCQLIQSASETVLIDKSVYDRLCRHEHVSFREIQNNSVQMFMSAKTAANFGMAPFVGHGSAEIYYWPLKYSADFLGYMEGVLALNNVLDSGFAAA